MIKDQSEEVQKESSELETNPQKETSKVAETDDSESKANGNQNNFVHSFHYLEISYTYRKNTPS
jgi:hypothetical protein